MRIRPIESPRNPFVRLMYRAMTRQFGKAITPMKVIFARLPRTAAAQIGIYWGLMGKSHLEPALQILLQHHVARVNGCGFCVDIGRAVATYQGLSLEKLDAVENWRASTLFSPAERAALAYVEEATRNKRVDEPTFERLRQHFNEREIVEITWLNALENYYNLINLPLEIESDGLCAIAERRRAA